MTKIKVFLGGFINFTNAQNLNCLALAKNIDKEKFDIYTLEMNGGNLESRQGKLDNVNIFNCFYPVRISGLLGFLWGIWNCDVAYLPKGEFWKWNRFWLELLGKKSFSTVEGILDEENLKSAIAVMGSYQDVLIQKKMFTKLFAITNFVGNYNKKHHNINVEKKTLYLGCEPKTFKNDEKRKRGIKTAAYIGRLKKRKGIFDFLEIAVCFPEIYFMIFGDGEDIDNVERYIAENRIRNVKLMGVVNHKELGNHLKEVDIHIFPSRSEGFPKVTLETAAAGVPSIVYGDYGAEEWITTGVNGWVVDTKEEIISIIEDLKNHPDKLQEVSGNAVKLASSFDWSVKIRDWEKEIIKLAKS